MKKSINKILKWSEDFHIYPGHGEKTTLKVKFKHLNSGKNIFNKGLK